MKVIIYFCNVTLVKKNYSECKQKEFRLKTENVTWSGIKSFKNTKEEK